MKNVYITGGHLTPALAVIDELIKKKENLSIIFIGREYAQGKSMHSREREEMEVRSVPFISIDAPKFHRALWWENISEIPKILPTLQKLFTMFRKNKPDLVVSFGGYVALPVALIAKLFGAKVLTHEQTRVAGLANQAIALFADHVAVSYPESARFFPKAKVKFTGNPIRESLFREYTRPPTWLPDSFTKKPFVYVTGGSQGSHIINQTLRAILPKLAKEYLVVHQCGKGELELHVSADLEQGSYVAREWIEAKEVSFLLRHAKFVISRAGANTVQELSIAGTPAIYIPLAFAYNDEQYKNCAEVVRAGASLLLLQKNLLPSTLWSAIQTMERRYPTLKRNMSEFQKHLVLDGTRRFTKLITDSLQ
ncbi:MAG TPA: UDP-N-acetylglucosamine--N-acetylmuramyl-(pentapeptide) pyrophosphoryl-undecaprenol N-acetylglucosamine transferase [Patescibacteria group bacterium]|nr:UDP-N-acetylglucosamine--N-acetylmuramyl-(pentapeptide) pyrophosphoryl-undecaprenol N-acetylglucosamine transferase [Patescibacteria group bacterium]